MEGSHTKRGGESHIIQLPPLKRQALQQPQQCEFCKLMILFSKTYLKLT